MTTIHCSRCGESRQALEEVPIPGEIGERIRSGICTDCYQAWKRESTQFIEANALRLTEADHRARLLERLKAFMGFDALPTSTTAAVVTSVPQGGPEPPPAPVSRTRAELLPCLPETGPRPYWPF